MKYLPIGTILAMCLLITSCDEMNDLLATPVADLAIINVSYQTKPYGCVTEQTKTMLSVNIVNNGQADAGAFTVEVDTEKHLVNEGLAAGEYLSLTFSAKGGFRHDIVIDKDNLIQESDKVNNSLIQYPVPILTLPPSCTLTPTGS
jgi:hypothetical protein